MGLQSMRGGEMNVGSLFSGIGGIELGFEEAIKEKFTQK